MKVHPYLTSSSAGLSINYANIGTNLANAGTVKVTRSDTYDISVTAHYAGLHVTVQVLGYYYRVNENDFRVRFAGSIGQNAVFFFPGNGCKNYSQVSIYVPGPGKITVNAQARLRLYSHTFGTADYLSVYIGTSATDCTFSDAAGGYSSADWQVPVGQSSWTAGSESNTIPVSRTFTVDTAGTRTYYLNGDRTQGNGSMGFWGSAMQATYYPDF